MVKNFTQFVNEGLGKLDAYRYIFNAVKQNLEQHSEDEEYMTSNVDDGICYFNISGKSNETLSSCENNITFMIMPPNFKPNLMVSLENGSYKRNTPLTKFQVLNDTNIVEATKVLYDEIKNNIRDEFSTIIITVGY